MYRASDDDRGTLQSLVHEVDDAQELGGIRFKLSDRAETMSMSQELYYSVLGHFRVRLPVGSIHSQAEVAPTPRSVPLRSRALFFDHVIVDHNQYAASTRTNRPANSLVAVSIATGSNRQLWVGELQEIFVIDQPSLGIHHFGHVKWLVPSRTTTAGTVWATLYVFAA